MSTTGIARTRAPSERIVETVAAREGVDPMDLDEPLFAAIDPDALDALLQRGETRSTMSPIQLTFVYHGYEVTVTSDGAVEVSEPPGGRWN